MPKIKRGLSEDRKIAFLQMVQLIGVCAEMQEISFQTELVDTRLKNPAINNHIRRIKESVDAIRTHLASVTNVQDRGYLSYEYAPEMFLLVQHFMTRDCEELKSLNLAIEEAVKKGLQEVQI